MCGTCYQRWWNEQNPGRTRARVKARENPATCHPERQALARGMCNTCYRRWWRLNNPGAEWERQSAAWKKKYRSSEGERRKQILRRYGITPEQYDEMFTQQGGVCAACGQPSNRRLQVDHCHDSEKIRGLLCFNCNSALGHAKDSVERLQSLIRYLGSSDAVIQPNQQIGHFPSGAGLAKEGIVSGEKKPSRRHQ